MLSNPNVDAADTGVDPSTGRYLTKKERIGIFKRRKIRTSSVFGKKSSALAKVGNIRGPLAKFGAIVKSDKNIIKKGELSEGDPQESKLGDRPEDKKIQPQNKLINSLVKQVENNSKKITLLKNIVKLNIQKVSKILVGDAEKEKKNQREDQRQQKIDDDKDKKKKKEGLLERVGKSVGKSLLKPVEAVGKSVKGILGRLGDAFMALFAGFVANKAIKMIQAHMSGDTETFKQMRNTIIKSIAVVGGIFLILNGGLLALPGIISGIISTVISLGGAMMAFMASPAGLIALGIAAGIGVLFALKKGVDAASTKAAGGEKFKQKFDELKGPLAEAGITVKGTGKDEKFYVGKANSRGRGQETVEKAGTPEQKEIVANYITQRDKVIGIRDNMRADMEAKESELRKDASRKDLKDGTFNKEMAKEKLEIRKKYEAQIDGTKQDPKIDSNTKNKDVKIDSNPKKNGVTTLDEPKTQVIDTTTTSGGGGGGTSGSDKKSTGVPFISPSNSDNNHVVYSQTQYNVMGV